MKTLKILKTVFIAVVIVALATANTGLAYAKNDKNEGNQGQGQGQSNSGNGNGNGQGNGNQGNNANNGRAVGRTTVAEQRSNKAEKVRNDAAVRANRPEKNSQSANERRGRKEDNSRAAEHRANEGKIAKAWGRTDDFFKALEKARWSHNPHDDRGQGNNGKVDMRDPYGHDKDSGREGSERGRPIHEVEVPLLNLAEIVGIDFGITDWRILYYQGMVERYQALAEQYPERTYYASHITRYQNYLDRYILYRSLSTVDSIAVNRTTDSTINYTMTFTPPDGFEGTNLLVTTSLISVNDYSAYTWVYDSVTGLFQYKRVEYNAGDAVMEQTQEVTLGTDNTINYSYDPPADMAGSQGFYAELAVTVTEPESGQSYTMNYDRSLYLYRCPYGKVTNVATGSTIVGVKVTVRNEDGSMVALDRASNANARNPQITDATGRYGFKLQINRKYYITAKADGYKEYKSPMFTEKWHVLREDISLMPIK